MKRKRPLILMVNLTMFIFTVMSTINPYNTIAKCNNKTSLEMKKDKLYEKIQLYRDEHRVEPIDATVDKIWKAIPGYNGLDVNIKASYNEMKQDGKFDENKIVVKEISPHVHLGDLPPNPIYRGNPKKQMVALLINVAWGNEYISPILNVLKNSNVKATFFFDGSWVKKNPEIAMKIYREGHEIGNHAYSHPDLQRRSKNDTIKELEKTNNAIEETMGVKPKWFAPPSGSFNQVTIQVAEQLNMKTILWTVDTVDWKKPQTTEMVNRIVNNVDNGSMVLMHPTKPVSEGLNAMISGIKAKGYQLSTVSDLMSEKRADKTNANKY